MHPYLLPSPPEATIKLPPVTAVSWNLTPYCYSLVTYQGGHWMKCTLTGVANNVNSHGLLQKVALWLMALWPYGLSGFYLC